MTLEDVYRRAQESAVIEVADTSLGSLARLVESGAIDISPQFQRRDRWSAERQSLLIESFFLNIPIPPIYLAEDSARIGFYAVIDGKQRLTGVGAFLSGDLQLRKLERMPQLNGMRFKDLPIGLKTALEMKSMRVTTLLRQSAEDLKHEVFLRLNTGGEVLNAQEIRNVAYGGPLNELVYHLAENEFLREQFKAHPDTPMYRKMADAEYVVRFLALSEGWRRFSGDIRGELDRFMARQRFADPSVLKAYREKFERSIRVAEAIWGPEAFKWPGRDQALTGLYDAVMIAITELSPRAVAALLAHPETVRQAVDSLFRDVDFDVATRQGTNTPGRLRYRVEQLNVALERSA
ncbi:DUF262 domain-containing protein [Microbacterium oleivorans]|nr:DUF262 domain-containing protein [Microbacterium oleivorans]